ncbi:hypothetical protein [Actinoplanes sp. G11-F43]|uniref:hypothetical protein n=1 Tax=Actinoplanes sp. G11-F43 TaxID=3424130 RepID=UPI003D3264BB
MTDDDIRLPIDLTGPQGHALLRADPPGPQEPKEVAFEVPPVNGDGAADHLIRVGTRVVFTDAVNEVAGWRHWHVKVYKCDSLGDARALCQHLHRQATALQRVNNFLPGQRGRVLEPPWAVVPVQVVRGDGQPEEVAGALKTQLGRPDDPVVTRVHRHLRSWLGDDTLPECVLLAASPRADPLDWYGTTLDEPHPATERLRYFTTLAAGLDLLHRQGWAHCDIKPDNVCRYTSGRRSEYVLIDTDAATGTTPPPTIAVLRTSPAYRYRELRRHPEDEPVRAGHLYAQDRFGLMLVVLCALAGRDWVEQVALAVDPTDPDRGRIADDDRRMAEALTAHWQDPRWQPLIRAIAEPFGPGPAGALALERSEPWAVGWLARLTEAEARCATGEPGRAPAGDRVTTAPPVAVRAVERVRRETRAHPAGRPQLVRRAYQVVDEVANDLAARQARTAVWLWGGGLTGAGLLLALNAFVMGR